MPQRHGIAAVATVNILWGKQPSWAAACAAVDAVEEDEGAELSGTWGLFPMRHLFKVFVLAYLEGILASSEIADFIANDPWCRMLCDERALKVELLRRFRRSHRGQLEKMLALGIALLEGSEGAAAMEAGRTSLYEARARSVVARAIFWDTMDSDS